MAAGIQELIPNPDQACPQRILHFQQKVGSLLYATVITRPDVAKTANKLSEYLCNPSKKHIEVIDRAIGYLYGTKMYAIEYDGRTKGDEIFLCASDAAFADNQVDRKSSEAYLCKLFGGPIDWRASKQKTVTISTTEAELLAVSEAGKQLFWWKRLFDAIGFDPEHDLSIKCDNQQKIDLLTNEKSRFKTKLRHVHHWLRQEVQAKRVRIEWCPTAKMPADGLTKQLSRQRHERFVQMLGLVNLQSALADGYVC